jgi:hypothetical protein
MKITFNFLDGDVQTFSTAKAKIIIGRSPKADIVVTQEGFSRQHCQIELVDGEVFITDLDSANGIFIDGKKIEPNNKVSYNTFLPMSFGPTKNIEIDPEAATKVGMVNPLGQGPVAHSHANHSPAQTVKKAAGVDRKVDHSKKSQSKAKDDEDKKSKMLIVLILVGLIAFGVYYFMNLEEMPTTDLGAPTSKPQKSSGKSDTVDF